MARFRCKSCPGGGDRAGRGGETVRGAATLPAGGCGVKDQVSRTRAHLLDARGRASVPGGSILTAGATRKEERMDLVLNGRGVRITDQIREVAEHKLGRPRRMEPRVTRLQIEVISEKNPRLGGAHRVEASFDTPRKSFRATADAKGVEAGRAA